tara:strand:+ start:431 stop:820 length:390 start_codon:yes stop_codon:yes gene_type:complete
MVETLNVKAPHSMTASKDVPKGLFKTATNKLGEFAPKYKLFHWTVHVILRLTVYSVLLILAKIVDLLFFCIRYVLGSRFPFFPQATERVNHVLFGIPFQRTIEERFKDELDMLKRSPFGVPIVPDREGA